MVVSVNDPHGLNRFVEAQNPVYETVCSELRAGRKTSHWMWFVFPQLRGLGQSEKSNYYGLASRDEAKAYLDHPILGARIRECTQLVNRVGGRSAHEIFGSPDDLKFRSSISLFAAVSDDPVFHEALRTFFGGEMDPATVRRLR